MLVAAIIMGLASSLHCVTMCSPLAMAVSSFNGAAMLNRVIYNLGRIATYSLLGALVGTVGSFFPIEKFENILSLALGTLLVVGGFYGISRLRIRVIDNGIAKVTGAIRTLFSSFLRKGSRWSTLVLGMVNGLLPCGMTFLALSVSLTTGNAINGVLYMALFGIGTLPAMLGMHSVFTAVVKKFNLTFSGLTTILIVASGFLLIARVFLVHGAHVNYGDKAIIDIIMCR